MTMPTTATGEGRRLEGGWFQRLAWTALAWGSLGFLVWVPFLYVAIRRGLSSDWTAFGAFSLYECVIVTWAVVSDTDDGDAFLGVAVLTTLLTATVLLLFAVFDKKPRTQAPAYGTGQANPYQQGYPYGR